VLDRDGNVCQVRLPVGTLTATVVDHVVPWRLGGAWYDPANLRASCVPCNASRVKDTKSADVGASPSRRW